MSIEAMKLALDALELLDGAETADGVVVYTSDEITALRQAIEQAEGQERWTPDDMAYRPGGLSAETPRVSEKRTQISDKAKKCIDHPDAPHGFNRDISLVEDRYVCDCEDWEPRALDEMAEANKNLAPWLSAALEDDNACDEFKSAVRWWFSSGSYDMQSMTRRVWQGLTDEDRYLNEARSEEEIEYARAIEAKLKEKNA